MARREYTAGRATTLDGAFNIGATSFTIADDGSATTWPTSTDYDFFVTIDAGTAQEERVLCSARSGRTITVAASGRGKDSTGEKNHASGATVWPSWSAQDADEANAHIESTGYASFSKSVHGLGSGDGVVVGTDKAQTLTGKTIDLTSNTFTGTTAQFNTALTDNNFATIAGEETLTNKTLTTPLINGDADSNTKIGTSSLNANTTGTSNTAIGHNALLLNTSGFDNVALGSFALDASTIANSNTAVGSSALSSTTIGNANTAVGSSALFANTSGSNNVSVGKLSLTANTTGFNNTAVGTEALDANTTGISNTAVGAAALGSTTTGGSNIGIGNTALFSNTTGGNNVAVGNSALTSITSNSNNTAVGHRALKSSSASQNTAVGSDSMFNNTSGINNVAIGNNTLLNSTTGLGNTAVGYSAGTSLTTGENNIIIGNLAQTSTATTSNQVVLGNSSITDLRCQDTTISAPSDIRDKTDVQEIPVGLDFINDIRPVNFEWNMRDGGQVGNRQGGFIAQEVLAVEQQYNTRNWLGMVNDDNPDQLVLAPAKLIPVLVKAIQELSARVAELESR